MSIRRSATMFGLIAVVCLALAPSMVLALDVKKSEGALERKEFFKKELYLSSDNVAAATLLESLPNKAAWTRFNEAYGGVQVFFDPRSGTASNIITHVPLIPGTGVGNHLNVGEVAGKLGRKLDAIDSKVVADLVRGFIVTNREAIGIDTTQLGAVRADQITNELWQISIPQVVDGIRVRWGRVAATISHGNLVLLGTESWGNVNLDTKPRLTAEQALGIGFTFVGGKDRNDDLWKKPQLEIVPVAPQEFQSGEAFSGPPGAGYRHRLVWAFGFQRKGEDPTWELLIDAHSGEVLSFEDKNQYEAKKIIGGAYPLTDTEICPSNDRCGVMQPGQPMPFANTGLAAPDDFTNSAGLYNYSGTPATTTFVGKFVRISDTCGAMNATSASGDIDLGGTNGDHDCTVPAGTSTGNTAATRSAFYEVNKLVEMAKGWLPANAWLQAQLQTNVNINQTCNAFYSPSAGTINFYRSGSGCRNTGEIAAVFDHEWGHGLDDNDTAGALSVSSEGYADIAAIYRLQASCMGAGFFQTAGGGCGVTSDGTGNNANESLTGSHCDLDCNGVRDTDWDKHADHTPDTPQNFNCVHCNSSGGPCGRQVHCDAASTRQAAWDFVARDLQGPPYNLSSIDAFIIGNKVFYQGSGNIGSWHACTCPSTSNGCGATNAYMQWLAADDDDGNVANGTPHMTALFNAWNRHNLACAVPAPVDSGCAGGPTAAPALSVSVGSNSLSLSWSAVPGAVTYRVLRSEGYAGCDFGKAVIANTAGTSYTDPDVANGRAYSYVVQAVGSSSACFSASSACVTATPQPCAGSVSLTRNLYNCSNDVLSITLIDADLTGTFSQSVTVSSTTEPGGETTVLNENPANSGVFTGTFPTTAAAPPSGGAISVSDGDTITVGYTDASFCGVPNVSVTKTASVDCQNPLISNVRAENVTGNSADVKWDTNEGASSQATYGLSSPPLTSTPVNPTLVTSHTTKVTGLAECSTYYYSVSSTDAAQNPVLDNNGGAYYTFETGKNVTPTYASTSPPVVINDNSTALATIDVTDVNVIQDVNVKVKITHTYDGDIELSLIGPGGQTVMLANRPGGSGDNYDDTVFDDEAATLITAGTAPFAGSFRPEQPLSVFDGTAPAGTWTLRVRDLANIDTGTVDKFELTLSYPPQACGPSLKYQSHTYTEACTGTGSGGGNGVIEPGETVTMPITIQNNGTSATTGISAVLSTSTPGVTILQAASSYPDLASGAAAPGASAFQFFVDSSIPCGTVLSFRIDMTANEGAWNSNLTNGTGTPGGATNTYNSSDVPKHIGDNGVFTSTISVPLDQTITDVNVTIGNITHTFDGDLDIFLIAPNGTRVELTTDNGSSGNDFVNTVLDDEAAGAVTAGTAPFTGSFRPEGSLAALDGSSSLGTWTLEITDDATTDTGDLTAWSITVSTAGLPICNVCDAVLPPGEVFSLGWSGSSKDTLDWTSAANATSYVLYRGADFDLPKLGNGNTDSCERMATAGLSSGGVLTETPSDGSFEWFLVRGQNTAGLGPAGLATSGPRVQDSSGVCP